MPDAKKILVFLAMSTFCMAGTTDDGVPDARYVEYAKPFSPYTARLTGTTERDTQFSATATLVADNWAVTAAHVASGAKTMVIEVGGVSRAASKVIVHPGWSDDVMGVDDIAMLKTDEPWGLDFYPQLSSGDETVGQTVSICGYGVHGKMSTGHSDHDGRLRAGTNTIHAFMKSSIVCYAERGSSPLEFCTAPGDSGGPLFANGKLAGINSFTMAPQGPLKSKYGEESGHTRISLYRDWIKSVTGDTK